MPQYSFPGHEFCLTFFSMTCFLAFLTTVLAFLMTIIPYNCIQVGSFKPHSGSFQKVLGKGIENILLLYINGTKTERLAVVFSL